MDSEKVASELLAVAELLSGECEACDEIRASRVAADVAGVFDRLRKGQKIEVAVKSVMGTSPRTSGEWSEWIVGRRSRSRKHGVESVVLIPADDPGRRYDRRNAFRLVKRTDPRTGRVTVGAAQGDMGIALLGIKA